MPDDKVFSLIIPDTFFYLFFDIFGWSATFLFLITQSFHSSSFSVFAFLFATNGSKKRACFWPLKFLSDKNTARLKTQSFLPDKNGLKFFVFLFLKCIWFSFLFVLYRAASGLKIFVLSRSYLRIFVFRSIHNWIL